MKTTPARRFLTGALAMLALVSTASAQQFGSAIALGARRHEKNSAVKDSPFGKGDYSGLIAYQLHDEGAYWRLGLGYAAEAANAPTADRVLTPQLHLVFHERFLAIAVGILKSFIGDDVGGDRSTKIYYDLQAGLEIPVGRFRVSAMAIYPFSDWGKLGKFSAGDVEYSAGVAFRF